MAHIHEKRPITRAKPVAIATGDPAKTSKTSVPNIFFTPKVISETMTNQLSDRQRQQRHTPECKLQYQTYFFLSQITHNYLINVEDMQQKSGQYYCEDFRFR